jgi:hypothetical protein
VLGGSDGLFDLAIELGLDAIDAEEAVAELLALCGRHRERLASLALRLAYLPPGEDVDRATQYVRLALARGDRDGFWSGAPAE